MSDELVWEEPPEVPTGGPRGSGKWNRVADELRRHPGQWARFDATTRSMAQQAKKRLKDGNYGDGFEATCRGVGHGAAPVLYVRYVGKPNLKATAS